MAKGTTSGSMGIGTIGTSIVAAQKAAAEQTARAAAAAVAQQQRDQAEKDRLDNLARIAKENDDWHRTHGTGPYAGTTPVSNPVSATSNSGGNAAPISVPTPAPVLPVFTPLIANTRNVKVAPTDIIQFDDSAVEIALIQDLLFEDIGATELANISRTDLIDGQEVIYAPIKNLSTVRREFNPNNIVATSHDMNFFSRFAIDLSQRGMYEPYFDDNGNLVIELDTVFDNEEIQVQVLSDGTINLVDNE